MEGVTVPPKSLPRRLGLVSMASTTTSRPLSDDNIIIRANVIRRLPLMGVSVQRVRAKVRDFYYHRSRWSREWQPIPRTPNFVPTCHRLCFRNHADDEANWLTRFRYKVTSWLWKRRFLRFDEEHTPEVRVELGVYISNSPRPTADVYSYVETPIIVGPLPEIELLR